MSNLKVTSDRRICIVSLRGVCRQAAWCSNYEFEDVACATDDVDLLTLEPSPRFEALQWLARRAIWRPGLRRLSRVLNPGVHPINLQRSYDLFVFVCMNPADLIYLAAINGWREKCSRCICFMVEFYPGLLKDYEFHLSLMKDFDDIVLCFGGVVKGMQDVVGRPCHHVPLGVDVLRFTPSVKAPVVRPIDVYSMGRRQEAVHSTLLKLTARDEIFYLHDTVPGVLVQPNDYRQHREMIANCSKRSQFFVAYPAKVDAFEETRGQSEVGARFFEGTAAGAILIGQAPTAPTFARDFNWEDSVVNLGGTEDSVLSALQKYRKDPESSMRLSQKNAVEALKHFDWAYRWRQVLQIARLEPTARLVARERQLAEQAASYQNLTRSSVGSNALVLG